MSITKIVQLRINGFDGIVLEGKIDNPKARTDWKKVWNKNIDLIDKAIVDFVEAKNETISYLFSEYCTKVKDYANEHNLKMWSPIAWQATHNNDKQGKVCYTRMRQRLIEYVSGNASEASRRMEKVFSKAVKDGLMYGKVSLPSFRENAALDFRGDSVKVKYDSKTERFYIDLAFIPKMHLHCDVNLVDKQGTKKILERIRDGIYQSGTAQIVKKNNKYFIQLSYKFEPEDALKYKGMAGLANNLDPERIMGVDLGLAKPVVLQPYDNGKKEYIVTDKYANTEQFMNKWCISGNRINNFRRMVEKKKKQKQIDLRTVSEGHTGKGRIKRVKPLDSYKDKIANFRKTTNFTYAAWIVKMAIKYGCGTIQMEDLGRLNHTETFLNNWTYYDLQTKIEQKAEEFGIVVRKIQPAYTSQRCSKCGHIDKENRPEQATFVCTHCGYSMNADVNAARNIALPEIERLIKKQLK